MDACPAPLHRAGDGVGGLYLDADADNLRVDHHLLADELLAVNVWTVPHAVP